MYTIVNLADGTHFRFHSRDTSGLRVSFDQTDAEQVWGVIPHPPHGYEHGSARWIAEYSASDGACTDVTSVYSR
jgi:hypothetical protein